MTRTPLFLAAFVTWFLATAPALWAGEAEDIATIKQRLSQIIPNDQPDVVRPTPLASLYEVIYGGQIFYVTADGRYLIEGDLLDLQKMVNLTERTRKGQRRAVLDRLDEDDMIVFRPQGEVKHVVTVFTDVDCGYCRKLHREIDHYLARGIEIRYLAFPRSGKFTESYHKVVSAWCAKDRQAALTRAKQGEKLPRTQCDNPVDEHMAAARMVGVSGTPTLLLEDGEMITGYVPADRLAQMLDGR